MDAGFLSHQHRILPRFTRWPGPRCRSSCTAPPTKHVALAHPTSPCHLGPFRTWLVTSETLLVEKRQDVKTTPGKSQIATEKWMVGRLLSFWEGNFSGAMLNFGGVSGAVRCFWNRGESTHNVSSPPFQAGIELCHDEYAVCCERLDASL